MVYLAGLAILLTPYWLGPIVVWLTQRIGTHAVERRLLLWGTGREETWRVEVRLVRFVVELTPDAGRLATWTDVPWADV